MNIIEIIKNTFKNKSNVRVKTFNKFIENNLEIKIFLENKLNEEPAWENLYNVFKGILFDITLKKCKLCNKTLTLKQINQTYCSTKCLNNDLEIRNKIKQTSLLKYGVDNPAKAEKIKEKSKESCISKYGVNNPAKSTEIKDKNKQTCVNKYNTEYIFQSEEIKEKSKETKFKRYNNEKYINIIKRSETIKNNKYNDFINNEKYKNVQPLFSEEEYTGVGYYTIYDWKCLICGNAFKSSCYSHIPKCPICFPKNYGFSDLEKEVADFCKQYYHNLIENDNTIISPYELDIVIPELNLAIEFNGNFYHSYKHMKFDKNYHFNKTNKCLDKNYYLIHIFEYEWINDNEKIKNKLKDLFGVNKKLINPYIKQENDIYFILEDNKEIARFEIKNNKIINYLIAINYDTINCFEFLLKNLKDNILIEINRNNFNKRFLDLGFKIKEITKPNKIIFKENKSRQYVFYDSGNVIVNKY